MIEMLRIYSNGFLENVTIEEVTPCGNGVKSLSLACPAKSRAFLRVEGPSCLPAVGRVEVPPVAG